MLITTLRKHTVGDMLDATAAKFPDREALAFKGLRLSYTALQRLSNRLARALLMLGVQQGDRVAIWMPNRPEWILARYAISKIGAALVPVSTTLRGGELQHVLAHSEATTLFLGASTWQEDYAAALYELCPELREAKPGALSSATFPALHNVIAAQPEAPPGMLGWDAVMEIGESVPPGGVLVERQATVQPDDISDILYTSGTSGTARGVMLSHYQVLRAMHNLGCAMRLGEDDRVVVVPPFSHSFGNLAGILVAAIFGACCLPLERFEPEAALALIERERGTVFGASPSVFLALLRHPDFDRYDLASLRTGVIGAASAPVALVSEVQERMHLRDLTAAYGMAETSVLTSQTRIGDPPELVATTVGRPFAGYELRIADIDANHPLPPGALGELCVRGYIVMKGYHKDPEDTARWIDDEGWWHTGDLAIQHEDGNLSIKGRLKDVFCVDGRKVYPVEVEDILFQHPCVKQVQVVGVPDPEHEYVGLAWVELKEGTLAGEDELIAFCRDRLPPHMAPSSVRFTSEWPMTPSGKVRKFLLREWAAR